VNFQSQTITGVTSTSVDWADLNTGTLTNGATMVAFEIRDSSAGGGGGAVLRKNSLLRVGMGR
jgi:hypothetical protein